MAITTLSNKYKYENGRGNNNFETHVYKILLLNPTFSFLKNVHGTLADVVGQEISANGGYARATLVVHTAWHQDDQNSRAVILWEDVPFTASGGNFDEFASAIIYNDTHADDLIIGHIDLESTLTVPDGLTYYIENVLMESV